MMYKRIPSEMKAALLYTLLTPITLILHICILLYGLSAAVIIQPYCIFGLGTKNGVDGWSGVGDTP